LKDHLGNVCAVIKKGGDGLAELVQQRHYYPGGMEISTTTLGASTNKYLYNGKEHENDFNLDWYDYGAMFYDPELGRWHSVDPKANKYYFVSSYAYCVNNPVICIDPDGRDIYIVNKDGSVAGKLTLSRTSLGKEIWNKYANSKTDDVYISSQNWTQNVGMAAGTLTNAEKNLVKDDKIDIGNNADFNALQGLDVSKSKGKHISFISVNKTFSDKNSKYGNAKTLFHEFTAHVDNPEASEQKDHEKIGIEGYEPDKDNPGYYKEKVKEGSTMDNFNKELKKVIIEDKSKVIENGKK
jgi:RHS repeat-associated protein